MGLEETGGANNHSRFEAIDCRLTSWIVALYILEDRSLLMASNDIGSSHKRLISLEFSLHMSCGIPICVGEIDLHSPKK